MSSPYQPLFVAIDVETTLNGNEDVGLAHPLHPDNRIVAIGMANDAHAGVFYEDFAGFMVAAAMIPPENVLCGHNFSFDLLYMYRQGIGVRNHFQKYKIWDTQIAEYILSGQTNKFASLNELCDKYGFTTKDDKVTAYFKSGLGADKVPKADLVEYLQHDLRVTQAIAKSQWVEAFEKNQLTLIQTQMEALHATTEMRYNGLWIDKEALAAYTVEVVNQYVERKLDLEAMVPGIDLNSPKQWSQFFFGGTKKVKIKEPVGLYKNGKVKEKLVEHTVPIPALVDKLRYTDKTSAATGQVSVDDSVLQDMVDTYVPSSTVVKVATSLLQYREISKQLSTYVQGLSKHIIGNLIHGTHNHAATVTGRLSSTNPNLQNISNNPIKKIFVSRWGDKGVIVEVDFNQLEVVALAHISRDKQLIEDISTGTDIHSALYEALYGYKPTKEQRKPFKARTFQLIYGAGASAISKQAKCSLDEAKKFIEVFYTRYPGVAEWHKSMAGAADLYGKHLTNKEGQLDKFRTYEHTTATGRKYIFKEYYNEHVWLARMYSFSPTELKNYPVQGLATGDIVPMMLGVLFHKFKNRDEVRMINTIHDSVMFDVQLSVIGDFLLEVSDTLKNTHKYYEETFKHPLSLKLNAGVSYGPNWFDMKEVTL